MSITISLKEYRLLLKQASLLETAQAHGVDNWDGWGDWHTEDDYGEDEMTQDQYEEYVDKFYADDTCHEDSRLGDVTKFHKAFGIEKPEELTGAFWALRLKLFTEEARETQDALLTLMLDPNNEEAMIEALDGMVDVNYISEGTCHLVGMDMQGAWDEVQSSNMSKLDDNGNPLINGVNCERDPTRPEGKVLKSVNFKEPQLRRFVNVK